MYKHSCYRAALQLIFEKKYIELDETNTKNWNFPKIHWIEHAFDDIVAKGASRNYNTKPNEKLHGPLKKSYTQSNFKDVAPQVCHTEVANIELTKSMADPDERPPPFHLYLHS